MNEQADDPKILANLKKMLGKTNPFTHIVLHENSTYNDLIFSYWFFYDKYGQTSFQPNRLTSIPALDRAVRLLPGRIKNIHLQERIRRYYST